MCEPQDVPRPPELPSQRVTADLRRRIAGGEWRSGDQMPSARELAARYGVSTRTAAKAYQVLAEEGLAVITPSWGTHQA